MFKTLFLSTLLVAFAFAGEADTKLPASAQSIVDKAEAAVAANRAAYDKANVKPLADAEKALKAELDKATKAGKLNEALSIQKVLEGLRDSVVASVDESAKQKGDLLGDTKPSDPKKLLVGKWEWFDGKIHTFDKNGTINGNASDTWVITKTGSIEVSWGGKAVDVITIVDDNTISIFNKARNATLKAVRSIK